MRGEIISVGSHYLRGSERHFSLDLNDDQYAQVVALVERWRVLPGRSYDLHRHNCVSFVKAIVELMGLKVQHADTLMMKPRSFLDEVAVENPGGLDLADAYVPKLKDGSGNTRQHRSLQDAD